jgi:hypothetical protein
MCFLRLVKWSSGVILSVIVLYQYNGPQEPTYCTVALYLTHHLLVNLGFQLLLYKYAILKILSRTPVAHTCNPSYSGGRDQEDRVSKPTWSVRPYLEKPLREKGLVEWLKVKVLSSNRSAKKTKILVVHLCTSIITSLE